MLLSSKTKGSECPCKLHFSLYKVGFSSVPNAHTCLHDDTDFSCKYPCGYTYCVKFYCNCIYELWTGVKTRFDPPSINFNFYVRPYVCMSVRPFVRPEKFVLHITLKRVAL